MSLPIFNFTKIESTNDFARSLITKHKIFKGIVIADEQTKGRGRYGNKWNSPKGNLYFTVFFPILRSNLKKIQFLVQLQIRNILNNYNIKILKPDICHFLIKLSLERLFIIHSVSSQNNYY